MAGILARCRGVARRSPEAERHTVAGIGVAGIGVGRAGAEAIGTIGTAIGAITIIIITTQSSSAASAFRTGVGGRDIRTDITVTATAIKDTAMAIKDTAMAIKDTAMAIDRGSRSCRGASRGLATTAAPLMESWDRKPGAPFALTNVRMVN